MWSVYGRAGGVSVVRGGGGGGRGVYYVGVKGVVAGDGDGDSRLDRPLARAGQSLASALRSAKMRSKRAHPLCFQPVIRSATRPVQFAAALPGRAWLLIINTVVRYTSNYSIIYCILHR